MSMEGKNKTQIKSGIHVGELIIMRMIVPSWRSN